MLQKVHNETIQNITWTKITNLFSNSKVVPPSQHVDCPCSRRGLAESLQEERPNKQPSDFVEIQLRIPKRVLMQTIKDVLYNP